MLFWMWIIIAGLALVIGCIFGYETDAEEEYRKLKEEKEYADRLWLHMPMDWNSDTYKAVQEQEKKAYAALDNFKKQHPNIEKKQAVRKKTSNIAFGVMIGALVITILMSIALVVIHLPAESEYARLNAEYEVLVWEVENNIYTDGGDDVVGKKELYNQVREWNAKVANNQAKVDDFWRGIFVPDFWTDLKPIELN